MKKALQTVMDNAIALGVVIVVLFMIITLPSYLLDFFLIVNIGLSNWR